MAGAVGPRWVLGLTQPTLRVDARWRFEGIRDSATGQSCFRPSVEMTLRYDPVIVYIGREFAIDDCAREFIHAHEMRHVVVHERRLAATGAMLQKELQERMSGQVHVGSRASFETQLSEDMRGYWVPRAERELKEVRAEHDAIDTPEEYARSSTACEGRIGRMLRDRAARGGPGETVARSAGG